MLDIKKLREKFTGPHYLLKTIDNKTLFLRQYEPINESNTAVLIFHGVTAYSGPYTKVIGEPIAKAGFAVFGLDLRGHGLSDGNRGDYPSRKLLLADIEKVISFLKEKYLKLIIMGHSLGVVTAGIALEQNQEKIDGLALLSAARKTRPGVYRKTRFGKKMKILFSGIFKPSKQVMEYYREGMLGLDDPLFNFKYTPRFFITLNPKKLKFPDLEIPVLLALGDEDELFAIDAAKELFEEIKSPNKEFIVFKGAKHAEFPDNSAKDIISWLNANFK